MQFVYQFRNRTWFEEHPDTLSATLRCADLQRAHADCCPGEVVYYARANKSQPRGRYPFAQAGYSAIWLTDQELNP